MHCQSGRVNVQQLRAWGCGEQAHCASRVSIDGGYIRTWCMASGGVQVNRVWHGQELNVQTSYCLLRCFCLGEGVGSSGVEQSLLTGEWTLGNRRHLFVRTMWCRCRKMLLMTCVDPNDVAYTLVCCTEVCSVWAILWAFQDYHKDMLCL